MIKKIWEIWEIWIKMWKSECNACGQFAPSKMKDNGICLYCIGEKEKLYEDVGWS